MTQYNTMLCLKTHSAILYKDVRYFRISLYSRIWFVNLIFIGISNYQIAYYESINKNEEHTSDIK